MLRTCMCIFIMMSTVGLTISQAASSNCSLNFKFSSGNNSSCTPGDWGGFLQRNCCASGFQKYLYALGLRANQTGLIYLNSEEQRSCLVTLQSFEHDVFSCGIEKLTSGGGGCSEFTVANVHTRMGAKLRSLIENCRLEGSVGEQNQHCGSCTRSWQQITELHGSTISETSKIESDVCRFAVLVSLTSIRIDDDAYIGRLYQCLGKQNVEKVAENDQSEGKMKSKINTGIWILISALSGVAVAATGISIYIVSRKRRQRLKLPLKKNAFKDLQIKESPCPKFSIKEVYLATNSLSEENLIGEGTAGKVYKGLLSSNKHVAIKHIMNDVNVESVVREVASLSHIRHPNLVALLGFCVRQDECFVLYELCPNGNLSEWIFGKDKNLSWIQRLAIAFDSARALHFLHTYSEGCIVHRDIKPTNILLGQNFEAKLSDFGLSKVMNLGESDVSSEVRGTFGYVDPEYQSDHQVNSSGDVYSFGIVLLQILSGKRVVNMNMRKPMPLEKMAKCLSREGSIASFADPKMEGEYSAEAFSLIFQLALSCTAVKQQRPTMQQVVAKLEQARNISTSATDNTATDS